MPNVLPRAVARGKMKASSDNYGTFSNRNGLGHPVFLVVPLIDPTEMLQ